MQAYLGSKMSKKLPRKRDVNQDAAAMVAALTGESIPTGVLKALLARQNAHKNPAAVALGRLGGVKGGKARAASLSPEMRKRIAQKAAKTRWENASKIKQIKEMASENYTASEIETKLGLPSGSIPALSNKVGKGIKA